MSTELVRHEPLTPEQFVSEVRMMVAALGRYRPTDTEMADTTEAWRRTVFPAVQGRAHWGAALDRMMADFDKMPTPSDALAILSEVWESMRGHAPAVSPIVEECTRPLDEHTPVELWVHNNPRRAGEGALAYIDRIAVGAGLIPRSLMNERRMP